MVQEKTKESDHTAAITSISDLVLLTTRLALLTHRKLDRWICMNIDPTSGNGFQVKAANAKTCALLEHQPFLSNKDQQKSRTKAKI